MNKLIRQLSEMDAVTSADKSHETSMEATTMNLTTDVRIQFFVACVRLLKAVMADFEHRDGQDVARQVKEQCAKLGVHFDEDNDHETDR